MNFSGWEILIVLFIVLLLFGSTRLPQLAKGMGKSIREFKKGITEGGDDEAVGDGARRGQLRESNADAAHTDAVPADKVTADKTR